MENKISLEKKNNKFNGKVFARAPRGTFYPIKRIEQSQPIPKSKKIIFSLIKILSPIIAIIIVYGVVNLILVGGQELWHSGDKKEMTKIEEQLKQKEKTIVNYEFKNTIEGLTETEYSKYTKEVDDYNELVGRYNELAEKVGSTWYVIPVPGKH